MYFIASLSRAAGKHASGAALFSQNPFQTVGTPAERPEVASTTAQGAVSRLEAPARSPESARNAVTR